MNDIIGLITTNYACSGMGELTKERPIASMPFGGRYRLIDFALSNMVNAGIRAVGLITPYMYRSLIDHVGNGKPWSLDHKNGGLFILPGSVYGVTGVNSRFLLRDIKRNRIFLERSPAPYVIITASNTIHSLNYMELYDAHRKSGADITVACKTAESDNQQLMGFHAEGNRVVGISHGVAKGDIASIDCFIINYELLIKILEWYDSLDYLDLFEALEGDFDKMDVRIFEYTGYGRSIFDVKTYYDYSMEMLSFGKDGTLNALNDTVMTKIQDSVPTRYGKNARVKNALVPSGCRIDGTVDNSVLFREVSVGKNAVVKDSIIFQGCIIEDGAYVERAIIDKDNVIGAGTVIKGSESSVFVIGKHTA